jgi:glycosyltransferase involved in cell wall biosynthesis
MIIGIDASQANREKKTGIEWYSYHLIQNLKNIPLPAGDKFILYFPTAPSKELAEVPRDWDVWILKWPLKYFWSQIKLAQQKPDILFSPGYGLPFFSQAKIGAVTVHDLGFKKIPKIYPFFQKIFITLVHYWTLKRANKIIAPSESTKKDLIDFYKIKSEKIKVIYEGYDKNIFSNLKDINKIKIVLDKHKIKQPYFLYVGRLENKKNINILLEAYNKLQKIESQVPNLILVGSPGFGYKSIKKKIKAVKQVYQIGYVESQDLPYFYQGAEAFIFPSFYEGFGLPIIEAMACGCPVIASRASSLPEVGGEAALYFNPVKTDELTELMREVLKNSQMRSKMADLGLDLVKNFSWQKCAEETMRWLLVGGKQNSNGKI